ncbi:MAG: DUF1896 family protein [Bacteroidota bacterium]|nr:DUF1896 family protein [Bacteroidota bacterium]
MKEMLKEKLWAYIIINNPDLMISLEEDHSVRQYLDTKVNEVMPLAEQLLNEGEPHYIIAELCINAMTEDLRPSRYQYIRTLLEEEFPQDYERLKENGTLTYEVVNLIAVCEQVFSDFDFNKENKNNRFLKYAIIGQVHDYLA